MICTLGDLLLDVIVRAPQPLAAGADTPVETRVVSGGQAANVAAWVVALGAAGALRREAGRRRDGRAGAVAARAARASSWPGRAATGGRASSSRSSARTASARWRPTAASRRSCAPTSSSRRWFPAASGSTSPATACWQSRSAHAALAAAGLARGGSARVSVDLSSWSAIRAYGPERFRERLEELAPDVVFANEASGSRRRRLRPRGDGGGEARLPRRDGRRGRRGRGARAALRREVVDTTGAGDALAAGFIVGGIEPRPRGRGALRRADGSGAVSSVTDLVRIAPEVQQALHDGAPSSRSRRR